MSSFGLNLGTGLSVALAAASTSVFAVDVTDNAATTAREFAQERRDAAFRMKSGTLRPLDEVRSPTVKLAQGVGVDYSDADVRSTTLPFRFSFLTAHEPGSTDWYKFFVQGDGLTRSTQVGLKMSGFADLKLGVASPLMPNFIPALIGTAVLTIPTRGDFGSRLAAQTLKLAYSHDLAVGDKGAWSTTLVGALNHFNARSPVAGKTSQFLYADINYTYPGGSVVAFHLSRSHRKGSGTTNGMGVQWDFFKIAEKLDASLMLNRSVSTGSRHTGVQFDLIYNL
ncbi:MAG: hypothetical protein ABI434_13065 [Burkholderiaceae bacterium]